MMFGFGIIGIIIMLLFWVALIFIAVWLVKSLFGTKDLTRPSSPNQAHNAREILDQRYARGELTREQYELMKSDLG